MTSSARGHTLEIRKAHEVVLMGRVNDLSKNGLGGKLRFARVLSKAELNDSIFNLHVSGLSRSDVKGDAQLRRHCEGGGCKRETRSRGNP
jgi:hypothetical protein